MVNITEIGLRLKDDLADLRRNHTVEMINANAKMMLIEPMDGAN